MIENIQKYRGVLIVAFVVAVIAFVFGDYSHSTRGLGGGRSIIKIGDREYTDKEVQRLGVNGAQLAVGLVQAGDMQIYGFLTELSGEAFSEEQAHLNFFTGRMLLRQAQTDYGIHPSQEKISEFIKNLRAFSGPEGKFSEDNYRTFIEKRIGRLGLTENDLRELASDILVSETLQRLLGKGLTTNPSTVALASALNRQQITAEIARLDLAPHLEKIKPTDEELKAYWQPLQDSFLTEAKRKFSYIIVSPNLDSLPSDAAEVAEAKRKEQLRIGAQVDDFLFALEEQKGVGFEELAKKNGWEVKTTDLFPLSAPPQELDVALRASSTQGRAVNSLFEITETSDSHSKISEALPIGENQWLVARLDGEEKARPKTFEEAIEDARNQYIGEKAAEALKTAATEAAAKIKAALASGKSFAEAAKEAGIDDVKPLPLITGNYQPSGNEPQNLFAATRTLDPGSITEPLLSPTGASIVYVSKREVVKDKDAEARLERELATGNGANEHIAFQAWLSARLAASNIQQPAR
ncbi:MAG: SurA N-terminal domain-containing protein [Luteolibacter sp.]